MLHSTRGSVSVDVGLLVAVAVAVAAAVAVVVDVIEFVFLTTESAGAIVVVIAVAVTVVVIGTVCRVHGHCNFPSLNIVSVPITDPAVRRCFTSSGDEAFDLADIDVLPAGDDGTAIEQWWLSLGTTIIFLLALTVA
jgi:hypothetical protein